MKKILLLIVLLFGFLGQAQKAEVQKTIETFFEGFHARDTVRVQSVCSEELVLQSISESSKGNKFSEEETKTFYTFIASVPPNIKYEERILSYNIQIDGTMAHAWTPYEFYIDGKLNHKGVNAFTLFFDGTSWKIVHLIDTRRK